MIPRAAYDCFWLGRYVERTENSSRLLFVTGSLSIDTELSCELLWPSALEVCGERPCFQARFGPTCVIDGDKVQEYLTWDEGTPSSIKMSVRSAREDARSIRDVLSLEVWEAINSLHVWLNEAVSRNLYDSRRYAFYSRICDSVRFCVGLLQSTMLHDTAFELILIGSLLERAGQTARILDVHHHVLMGLNGIRNRIESAVCLALLETCSGSEPFVRVYQGYVGQNTVFSFLVSERRFPRSILHCLEAARDWLLRIEPTTWDWKASTIARLEQLIGRIPDGTKQAMRDGSLHEHLTMIVDELARICDGLGNELRACGVGSRRAAAMLAC